MATTTIYLDLSKLDKWLSADNDDGTISGTYEQRLENIPNVHWSINALPFSTGVKSLTLGNAVGIPENLPSINAISNLWEIRSLVDSSGNLTYLILDDNVTAGTNRKFHVWDGTEWVLLVEDAVGVFHFFHRKVTVFQNQTVFVLTLEDQFGPDITVTGDAPTSNNVFLFDVVTKTADVYNLIGIQISGSYRKNGITSYQNYLIFWDTERMYWSSPTDFADFTPAIGGGGSTQISEAKGDIITIVPNTTGLVIYCKLNIIHAAFSGDSSNPWVFREIPNGTGILIEGGNPIVTTSESSEVQIYMGAGGISMLTENGAQPLDVPALEFLNNNTVETKPRGTVTVTEHEYDLSPTAAPSKVRDLSLQGNNLFIFVGELTADMMALEDNRVYIYNLNTRKIAKLDGDYHSVHPHLNMNKQIDSGEDLFNKVDAFPAEFILGRRYDNSPNRAAVVINLADGILREDAQNLPPLLQTRLREAEVLVGPVSMSRSGTTVIYSIKPDGKMLKGTDESTRAEIYVYSATTMGASNPTEFIYNPLDGTYYGEAEGKDLMIEIIGRHFYLTGMSVEIGRGGTF